MGTETKCVSLRITEHGEGAGSTLMFILKFIFFYWKITELFCIIVLYFLVKRCPFVKVVSKEAGY